jgi:hypothetical protein
MDLAKLATLFRSTWTRSYLSLPASPSGEDRTVVIQKDDVAEYPLFQGRDLNRFNRQV